MNLINADNMPRDRIINSGLIFVGCVAALLIAEIALREVLPGDKTDYLFMGKPDAVLGYVRNPDKNLLIDDNGFKNRDIPGQADIVALGDSFTWGYTRDIKDTVETAWPYALSSLTGLSVYNMGVGGYGPVQYYALLDKALSFKPKYLIIGVFIGNDYYDAYNMAYNGVLMGKNFYEYYGLAENRDYWQKLRSPDFSNADYEVPTEPEAGFGRARKFIRSHSVLYDFLANGTYSLRVKARLAKIIEQIKETDDWTAVETNVSLIYKDKPGLETKFLINEHAYGVDYQDKRIGEGMKISFELFDKIKATALESGAEPIFIMIPTKKLVYEKILGDKIKENRLLNAELENEKDLRLKTFKACKGHGLTCIDLLASLQNELAGGRKLYTDLADGHLAPEGYKAIAEIIREELISGE